MMMSRFLSCAVCAAILAASHGNLRAQLPVTDGLELWLDATDASTLFDDDFFNNPIDPSIAGGIVGGWEDKSPNGYQVFNRDSFDITNWPTYEPSAMNGQPAVRFSGADADAMHIDFINVQRPYSIFIVNQYWGDIQGRTLQSASINWLHGLWAGNVASYANGWVSDSGNMPATINTPYVADTVGTDTSTSFFLNGDDFTNDPNPLGNPGELVIGAAGMFPGEVSDADVSEIIIYNRALQQSELDSVRTYLYDKYAPIVPYELPPPDAFSVQSGTVGQFSGADPGESRIVTDWSWTPETDVVYTFADGPGLDFDGDFVQAINVGGPGFLTVGDVEFKEGTNANLEFENPGVTMTLANEILNWHAPEYGDSTDDDNLEVVMQSIRWNVPPGVEVDIEVEQGNFYKLQLLFAENCCNRGYDIFIEDEEVVSNLIVQEVQEGIANTAAGVFYETIVEATDDVLNILLGGQHLTAPDNNPILSALTLELVDPPVIVDIPGDYDGDNFVGQGDIDLVLLNWGADVSGGAPNGWTSNLPSGSVDQDELDAVLLNWGNSGAVGVDAVPEPTTWLLAALLGIGLLLRAVVLPHKSFSRRSA